MAALLTRVTAGTVGTTTVTGTIYDPSGYPLAGIEIRLYDGGPRDGSLVETTTTDDAGCYRFAKVLTDGMDSYRFEADDMTGHHVYAGSPSFVVKVGVTATHDLTMRVAGIIQGNVDTSRESVLVIAEALHWSAEAAVSAAGTFRLVGLPAGIYDVTLRDTSGPVDLGVAKVKVTAGRTTTLMPQWISSRRA